MKSWLYLVVLLAGSMPAGAGVSFDESAAFSFDTRDYLAGLAAESAVFAFDTRVVDGLQSTALSASFTFDTRGTTLPPLQITGVLRDSAGVPVVGATIQIKRAGAIFWQGVSGAGGAFTTPNLSGVNYTVIVAKPGYVTSITNMAGTAGGLQALNLQITAMPVPPTAVAVNRIPAETAVRPGPDNSDPAYPMLARWDGLRFVYDVSDLNATQLSQIRSRMTVVITHGWLPTFPPSNIYAQRLDWAIELAALITQHHSGPTPNIVAWDWGQKAHTFSPKSDVAFDLGPELGKALHLLLGADYSQHVHFVGHSLGTIVNRYACDYAHGSLRRGNPVGGWQVWQTTPHVTLLDEAEITSVLGTKVIHSASLAYRVSGAGGALIAGVVEAKRDWKYPLPYDAVWADNYLSAVGLQHEDAVNVALPGEILSSGNPIAAHSYAHEWYRDSVYPPASGSNAPPVGFGSSLEAAGLFPPSGSGQSGGSLWYENLSTADALDLTLATNPEPYEATIGLYSAIGMLGPGWILDLGYKTGIQWAHDAAEVVGQKTGQVIAGSSEKIGLWWDAAMDQVGNVRDSVNFDAALPLPLSTATYGWRLFSQQAPQAAAARGLAAAGGSPPQVWITVKVPPDAGFMAFDFTVSGDPVDDRLACAVDEQNVFTLPAKFVVEGEPLSTDLLDVSAYAGETIEVYFGLVGGTSTNCEVAIDGLRFITVPPPKIALAPAGANVAIKWPAAASGWVLESSDSLALASWQTVSMASGVTLDSGVATLEELMSGARKFYRLRRAP